MILYEHRAGLYLNITNRCPVACAFCIKKEWSWQYRGQDLKLGEGEPTVREIIDALTERLSGRHPFREVVFCGYGEPTVRMDVLNAVGLHLRLHQPDLPIRLNTIGLGSLIHGRDVVPELALFLDSVSVSLNVADEARWEEVHRPAPQYRGRAFPAVRAFIQRCVAAGLRTRVTAVDLPGLDVEGVRRYAEAVGAEFLPREALA